MLLATAHYFVLWPHRAVGDYRTGVKHIDQALALFLTLPLEERKTARSIYWNSLWQMFSAWCRAETGEFVRGIVGGRTAGSLAGRCRRLVPRRSLITGKGISPAPSESCGRSMEAIATDLSMRPLAGRCHLARGRKHRAADPSVAEHHLTIARTIFRETHMRHLLEKSEAALKPLR